MLAQLLLLALRGALRLDLRCPALRGGLLHAPVRHLRARGQVHQTASNSNKTTERLRTAY